MHAFSETYSGQPARARRVCTLLLNLTTVVLFFLVVVGGAASLFELQPGDPGYTQMDIPATLSPAAFGAAVPEQDRIQDGVPAR